VPIATGEARRFKREDGPSRQQATRERSEVGGEAGIRTLGRTLKALQRFSKPPPSASRPPHRATCKYTSHRHLHGNAQPESRGRRAFKPPPLTLSATTRVLFVVGSLLVSGTVDWGTVLGTVGGFLTRFVHKMEENEATATVSVAVASPRRLRTPAVHGDKRMA
jgi:hypothetical protein